ncbi:hypothetical protein T492DRAFT_1057793 [Pavlovales sp. CCMP2436]|nr:hypothetical protein T492DRAFT_1057793 [Pavlovales sp. CCMP2436]
MGARVLAVSLSPAAPARASAGDAPAPTAFVHCARQPQGTHGGVTLLVVNPTAEAVLLELPDDAVPRAEYRLTAAGGKLTAHHSELNGRPLAAAPDGSLPELAPVIVRGGSKCELTVGAQSITFFVLPARPGSECAAGAEVERVNV